jgi:PII-like signaling protein
MSHGARKLTVYFGERDRVGDQFLAERLIDIFETHRLAVSLLMRGVEGFGIKHHLRTDRLLTLSEDLPIVAVGVDETAKVDAVLGEVKALDFDGLITVERAQLENGGRPPRLSRELGEEVKLTVYFGRGLRSGGRPAYEQAVQTLHDHRVAGATVLLGVDGTFAGRRRRARFFSRNVDVPAMVISIGTRDQVTGVLSELETLPGEVIVTLERVRSLKRDGQRLARLGDGPGTDADGLDRWVKLMLYSSEQNQHDGHPAHVAAIHALRAEGAPGATALRGIWGYHGDHEPHGDRFWTIRRRVPTVTVVVDKPPHAQRWLDILDQVAPNRGLITAEVVPAFQASGPELRSGGLRLAAWWREGLGG